MYITVSVFFLIKKNVLTKFIVFVLVISGEEIYTKFPTELHNELLELSLFM